MEALIWIKFTDSQYLPAQPIPVLTRFVLVISLPLCAHSVVAKWTHRPMSPRQNETGSELLPL